MKTEIVNHIASSDSCAGHSITFMTTLACTFVILSLSIYECAEAQSCLEWMRLQPPQARSNHAMVYDSARQRTILYGGIDGSSYFNDLWEWDGAEWKWLQQGLAPTTSHAMAYDIARDRIVKFGGYGANSTDTWEWDGNEWIISATTGPSSRSHHAMVYDAVRQRVVLFGGHLLGSPGKFELLNDTWEWDGKSWTQVASTGPVAREDHAMAYDSVRERVVMFGGYGGPIIQELGDTWEWDGTAWVLMAASGPSARDDAAMAFDVDRGVTVLYGGDGPASVTSLSDTWE